MESLCYVLLKEQSDYTSVMAVYLDKADIEARIEKIGRANPQYPLRKLTDTQWVIGPEEDEGFFGNKPVTLYIRESKLHG